MQPKGLVTTVLIITLVLAAPALGQMTFDNTMQEPTAGRERPCGRPPEAFIACKGKKVGEAVLIETPHGDEIAAVCKYRDERLVAQPLNGPPPRPDNEKE
ncbi:hypothetical protein [uncultured Desulfobulbus sp.]|uniref:hypothetical protein n=1 Tax=uncultured Desulfobulbus sp. TaxID=239745 RepID=UPI0029C63F57|nr:hypothetical protein [uncultured Desulfobulbus sp.]